MRRFGQGLCCALALGLCASARAESFRTLIVVDASSSMRRTDPQKLRKVAAELYVDLARDGDSIAVVQFQAAAKDVSGGFQKITGPQVRDRLKDAIRSIGDDGEWTDFGAAFDAAKAAFAAPAAPGEKRFLVFLTDGKCEPAPDEPRYLREGEKPEKGKKAAEDRGERCKTYVLSQALPALQGVEAEVIGLSKSAPREFLEEVARRGGGRAVVTEKAEDLPPIFAKIHAFNSGAVVQDSLATSTEVRVDRFVSSLDLVMVPRRLEREMEIEIHRPDGNVEALDGRQDYYVRAERYRFIRIPSPAPGTWRVSPTMPYAMDLRRGPALRVEAIQNYDLRLHLQAPEHATVGQPLEFRVVLAAGEGGGLPEASFLARHRFSARAKVDGAFQEIALKDAPDGAKVGTFVPAKVGALELSARVEPGPDGALTRASGPRAVTVVPPLALAFAAPLALGELKPGGKATAKLDLSKSDFLGEVKLEARAEGMPLAARPEKLELEPDQKAFEIRFEVPHDAAPGAVSGALVLTPVSKPYLGREGVRVPVSAMVVPLTFWEKHGGKVVAGSLLLLAVFLVAGFKTPARFPRKIRVWYQDKPNSDEGDFGLWLRGKPGFYKPATFRIGGGGPVRRASPLLCEIVATKDGMVVRPARGRTVKSPDGDERTREFRPDYQARYQADEGLIFWIGKEEEED